MNITDTWPEGYEKEKAAYNRQYLPPTEETPEKINDVTRRFRGWFQFQDGDHCGYFREDAFGECRAYNCGNGKFSFRYD